MEELKDKAWAIGRLETKSWYDKELFQNGMAQSRQEQTLFLY
jgi:hypothetical protein